MRAEEHNRDIQGMLRELYELLEAYAPACYSQELSERMLAALKALDVQKAPEPRKCRETRWPF